MNRELKVGDKVRVVDIGLLRMMAIMPDMPPCNIGFIKELNYGGSSDILIEFPIGDNPIDEHSQVSPYPKHMIRLIED